MKHGNGPRKPRLVTLPCCETVVAVTSRPSKIGERPRNHGCPKCGGAYRIGADSRPILAQ